MNTKSLTRFFQYALLTLLLWSYAFLLAQAQPPSDVLGPDGQIDREKVKAKMQARFAQIAEEINLTDQQKAQIDPIKAKYRKVFAELKADESLSRFEKFREAREIFQDIRAEIAPILSAEQNAQLDEIIAEQRKKRRAMWKQWKQNQK